MTSFNDTEPKTEAGISGIKYMAITWPEHLRGRWVTIDSEPAEGVYNTTDVLSGEPRVMHADNLEFIARATVWADGFGVWHASVPLSGSRQRDAATARKLILAELEARGNGSPISFRITRDHVTTRGTAVYKEVTK